MMSIWHLLWIVPTSAMFGFFVCALLSANGPDEEIPLSVFEKKDDAEEK